MRVGSWPLSVLALPSDVMSVNNTYLMTHTYITHLLSINQQENTLTGSERSRHFVTKINMPL